MAHNHRHGSIRKENLKSQKHFQSFPQIFIDKEADFASIKLAPGIESRSYLREGFVFCEDKRGRIIEIQVLNLSLLKEK